MLTPNKKRTALMGKTNQVMGNWKLEINKFPIPHSQFFCSHSTPGKRYLIMLTPNKKRTALMGKTNQVMGNWELEIGNCLIENWKLINSPFPIPHSQFFCSHSTQGNRYLIMKTINKERTALMGKRKQLIGNWELEIGNRLIGNWESFKSF